MNDYSEKIFIKSWGSSAQFSEFPYEIAGVNTTPEYDATQNDVDKDSYTNTNGKTVRNRLRSNVKTIDFNVPIMSGEELHNFFNMTEAKWLAIKFFDEEQWGMITKKMYRSGTVSYHKYYMHSTNPNLNIYTNIQFSFIEE